MESQNQGTVAQDDVLVPAHHPGQVKTHGAAGPYVSTYHDAEA